MIERKPSEHREVYVTNNLHMLMKQWEATETPEELSKIHYRIGQKFMEVAAHLKKFPAGKERAKEAHRMVQAAIGEKAKEAFGKFGEVQCKLGCAGCCHMQVAITPDESEILAELVENGVKIDEERLERMASREFTDLEWWRQPAKEKACLFLSEGNTCRIYANRPMNCRKYFVLTPPEKCSEVSEEGSIRVGVMTVNKAEIIASAVMDFDRGDGNMPQLLKQALARRRSG